jgi:hypothetical protein
VTTYLHLTNGKAIVPLMRDAGISDPVVPWDDVLHEGPVPEGLGVAALREWRAAYLAGNGWSSIDALRRSLTDRDTLLEQAVRGASATPPGRAVDQIVLWLEHDLFDQLHRLQILDRVPLDGSPRVTAVPDDEYLGSMPPDRFRELFDQRRDVTSAERLAARDAWSAFRSPDPRRILEVLPRVTVLRHAEAALRRHLEQFPSIDNGLSRTEQQALEAIAAGSRLMRDVYEEAHHKREAAVFMGDAAFLIHVGHIATGSVPLIRRAGYARHLRLDDEVELTEDGRRVLDRTADRIPLCGIDRWLGGVQLSGTGPVWRWDADRQQLRLL